MADIILEIIRAIVVSVIFIYLWMIGRKEDIHREEGWLYIIGGFGLILFGMLIDITDNFPSLSHFIIIGDTKYQAFIEKVVGYLFGFIVLTIGFWKWMPTIIRLREAERELKKSHDELELKVIERTTDMKGEIEERKEAEEALKETNITLQTLIQSIPDIVYFKDNQGRNLMVNKAFEEEVGLSREEIIGKTDAQLFPPELSEHCRRSDEEIIKNKITAYFEEESTGADGKRRFFATTKSPLFDIRGHYAGLVGISRDITESKAIEAQLRQARKMESIGTLAGGIAHDFNNILYMITGNAELALEDIPEWNPAHASLKEIKAAGLRGAGIVKQLLSFSRKTDQELKPIGAVAVIKDALRFLRSTIPATIEIRKHLPDTDVTTLADSIQINQVLMNICTNASQAMEESGGILEINVEKESLTEDPAVSYLDLKTGEYVKITISDTGPGINPEIIDRVFDPYFTTREFGKGSGMGLSVVLGIVKNHGGAITVDSQPGEGATFTMLFPVAPEKPVTEAKTSDGMPIGTEAILFVDDEESIANLTGQMLERLGYKVETKLNPVEALELFESEPDQFDLVITDMTMPQMTGARLSEKLKEVRSDIPVIIFTGHSSLIDEKKEKAMGIAAFVMKPIVKSDIAKTIREVLDDKKNSVQN